MARSQRREIFDVTALAAALKKGVAGPIYVLAGGDAFFRTEGLRLLRKKVLGKADPALSLLEYDDTPAPAEVFDNLRTQGLFSSERLVVIDPADRFVTKYGDELSRYAKSASLSSCLALAVDQWKPKADLGKHVGKSVTVVSCTPLHRRALPAWLTMRAKVYGKRLDAGVGQMLIESAGTGLAILDRHLQNLAAYIGDQPNVSAKDVAELVGGDPQRATWELVSAVVAGNAPDALKLLHQMFRRGTVVLWAISALANEFSRLWRVKRMIRDRKSDEDMLAAIGRQYQFRLRHIKREAEAIPPSRLLKAGRILLESDLAAKTSAMPDELLLECLVLKLCDA